MNKYFLGVKGTVVRGVYFRQLDDLEASNQSSWHFEWLSSAEEGVGDW